MYAIIVSGGKQYRVSKDDVIEVEKLGVEPGQTVDITDVLAVSNEGDLTVGTPVVDGAVVKAEVVENGKSDKIIIYKYKSKKDYRRKQGHRQPYTKLKITDISI